MAEECTFCRIIQRVEEGVVVYEDDEHLILMDKHPYNPGHNLVIPKKHYKTLLEMPKSEAGKLFEKVWLIAKATVKALDADGIHIGQNNGRAARQVIDHVHVHIIPRFYEDEQNGRWPSRKTIPLEESRKLADMIRQQILHFKEEC
ncbi:MAG: HIT family protein [Nitrososphaerales archaeon]